MVGLLSEPGAFAGFQTCAGPPAIRKDAGSPGSLNGLTLPELARMMDSAIKLGRYQQETRLGASVAQYLAWKKPSAADRTLVLYENYLARLCKTLADRDPAIDEVTSEMLLEAWNQHKRGSLRVVRSAFNDFFKWGLLWEHCTKNPALKLPPIPDAPMKVYEVFSAAEQTKLLMAADQLPMAWVQRLRVLCMVDLGVRSSEARGLTVGDFDTVSRVVVVRGKGSKERVIPLSDELWKAFVQFRNRPIPKVRMEDERGVYREDREPRDSDYIFFANGIQKGRRLVWTKPDKPLSDRGMRTWWERNIIPLSGVKYRSLHMNRHTVGTDLASGDVDVLTIQEWLGHASPDTTQVYVHNSRSRLRTGSGKLEEYRKAQGQ